MSGRTFVQLVATGLVAAGLTWGIARASSRRARPYDAKSARANGASVRLAAPRASYLLHPGSGTLAVRTSDGAVARELALRLVVDGEARPLTLERAADRATEHNSFGASFGVAIGEDLFDALVALHVDAATGALAIDLTVQPEQTVRTHQFALRLELPTDGRNAFVSGVGEIGDLGTATGRSVEIDADPHAIGIAPASGVLDVTASADAPDDPTAPMRIAATSAPQSATDGEAAHIGLRFVIAEDGEAIWRALYTLAGEPVARVAGVVAGVNAVEREMMLPGRRPRVFGLDGEGLPRVRVPVREDNRFELFVPTSVVEWYAAIDPTRSSTPVAFTPGTPWDLRLDVSPGGDLTVRVVDVDTGDPITVRLLVHGIDGTLDPSFGPDYRASGAGPLIDALRGEVTTPLPSGRYRVAATKGIEWSIDAKTIEVVSGRKVAVDLALRHVVPTPGVVSCDLHVHARPSFDTPVLSEDRVLSLVSAGVDFAVPSEHNIVGDYGPALDTLGLNKDLATVQGVEITTFAPRFGHFGLFPYALAKVPPFRGTNVHAVFGYAHKAAPNAVLQVNHPRLGKGIGYFDVFHFDPRKPAPFNMRTDFDTLEVYNGYESRTPERIDVVLRDWFALLNLGHRYAATGSSDSHRIQYQWAGYPRTMAAVGEQAAGDHGGAIDTQAVVSAIKKGRSFVTSGPMIELDLEGAHPGDEIATEATVVHGHLRVRAAPWIDVTSAEVVVGGKTIDTFAIPSRPLTLGAELGGKDEAASRTIRFDADLSVSVGLESTWVVVIVRGARKMDDVLPFMPVPPRAFTNPVYVTKQGGSAPAPPRPSPPAP